MVAATVAAVHREGYGRNEKVRTKNKRPAAIRMVEDVSSVEGSVAQSHGGILSYLAAALAVALPLEHGFVTPKTSTAYPRDCSTRMN